MLLDLLSTSNQISFNIKVAQLFGLKEAVYLSELMVINEKAIRKNKVEDIDGLKFFTISRPYITNMTTLTSKEQKEIEESLNKVGIIKILKDSPDTIYLDIETLGHMLGSDLDKSVITNIKKITTKKTKEEQTDSKVAYFKEVRLRALQTTNIEKRKAYANWIEAGLRRYGATKFSDQVVRVCEKQIEDFTNGNTQLAVELISANIGYNTMAYVIENYQKSHFAPQVATVKQTIDWSTFKTNSEVF